MTEKKHVLCTSCDNACPLLAEVEGKELVRLVGFPDPKVICSKGLAIQDYIKHPKRLLHPLKNVGKRGEQKWERMSWEQALDEIAEKLKKVIDNYGPEAFALSTVVTNAGVDQGTIRRFMNLLGSPNWITGLNLCMGNTAQVHRITYGWYTNHVYNNIKCIVLDGHNPHRNNWTKEYYELKGALENGAKLIVLDPRKSECAKMADIHLPLRYGTDGAMFLGWLNVVINEELYDKEFVKKWTVGFEQLKERVQEYPLSKVSEITGCEPETIREAAVMYATSGSSIIPWGPIPDMQKNSTSLIRCHSILRAICGFLNKNEILGSLSPDVISISEMEMHEILPDEKKKIQLGTENYPLFTYEGLKKLNEPTKKVYGREYVNNFASFMAHPPTVFKAMRTGKPYPVKAFFSLGSNPIMGYVNQQGVFEALMNQELVVVFDHLLTPTAQLADYVLPGDSWIERPNLLGLLDNSPVTATARQILDPPGECKDQYYLIRELAIRMGLGEYFPWKDLIELFNYRIKGTGMVWEEYEKNFVHLPSKWIDPFTSGTGLATPSGKVELYSSILESLGYDPLPYYKEPVQSPVSNPELAKEYPLTVFIGLRENPYYNTNLRHIGKLRKQLPNPLALINPKDGQKYGIESGEWIFVETTHGRVKMMAELDEVQPPETIRIPHGWWMAEMEPGLETGLSGAMIHNDAMLVSDEEWNLDPEQGVANLRGGILAKIYKTNN